MNAALLVQTYSPDAPDKFTALLGLALLLSPFALVILGLFYLRHKRKKEYEKARRNAHTFKPANVHGNAGVASKDDLRRKGWVK
jgi:hypothetical protein